MNTHPPTTTPAGQSADDRDVIEAGYEPQLHRRLSSFGSFAVSFSVMSVLMGVFANYGYVLGKAGPFGLWTWVIVGIGQMLVAMVFADMAGRVPLTGALYNWNYKLGYPKIGWLVGWLSIFAYAIGAAGILVAFMPPLSSLVGHELGMPAIRAVGLAILLLQLLISLYGVELAGTINRLAVIVEILALLVFGFVLLGSLVLRGGVQYSLLTNIPSTPAPYWPAFLISSLLGSWTIFGFESPADVSEETRNVKQVAPRSILLSVATSVVLGFFFIVVLTLGIPNLANVTAAADPISAIVAFHLGGPATDVLLICVLIAMFATALLNLTVAARILFAISRDGNLIGSDTLRKVSGRGIPAFSTASVVAVEAILFLTMYGLAAVYAAAVVLLFLAYLATVVTFASGSARLSPPTTFSLGKWQVPVVSLAILWLIVEIGILTIPQEFHLAAEIAIGLLICGGLVYLWQNTLRRTKRADVDGAVDRSL